MISVAYMTNRRNCRWEWFRDSVEREMAGVEREVVVVDFHGRGVEEFPGADRVVEPKPNPWQGKWRLTPIDFFAAANARNTAICVARGEYLVYVDDLSVLLPGWGKAVMWGVEKGVVVCGTYEKVFELEVVRGEVVKARRHAGGMDSRIAWLKVGNEPVRMPGGALFGCSVGAPMKAWLDINGWDEDADSMGGEDSMTGLMLGQNGWEMWLHPEMKTYESEEAHGEEPSLLRIIKRKGVELWGDKDFSHTHLRLVKSGERRRSPNYYDVACLREMVLGGGKFPTEVGPERDWRDGQLLREMNKL